MKTCFSCLHFLGGDDWGLCCDVNDTLCYFDTEACDNYEKVDSDEQLRRNKKLHYGESPRFQSWDGQDIKSRKSRLFSVKTAH